MYRVKRKVLDENKTLEFINQSEEPKSVSDVSLTKLMRQLSRNYVTNEASTMCRKLRLVKPKKQQQLHLWLPMQISKNAREPLLVF
jgi:hypothetical protein